MDQLTREAIDERLRILENVSGTVYRCVEDLLRLRSTLPAPEVLNGNFPQHTPHEDHDGVESTPRARNSTENSGAQDAGKGKAVDRGPEDEPVQGMSGSSANHLDSPRQKESGSEGSFEVR